MSEYKFYMQECDKEGNILVGTSPKDLEVDFAGLRYKECKGLNTIGAANVYTESYADSNRLRVHVPSNLTNKATTVTLSLYFIGEDRYKVYDAFNEYLRNSPYHIYYDTARKKRFAFFVKEEISPSVSQWYGSTPYIEVSYKLSNIFGRTFDVE
jgi:hypothetical protein